MKLKDFIIGMGLFGLVSIIIFGMINPDNSHGIYGDNYLNITMDEATKESIQVLGVAGENASQDFDFVGDEIEGFVSDRDSPDEPTEDSLLAEGIKILLSIPKFFGTVPHVLGEVGSIIGIPDIFIQWVALSIVIILVLMIATAFLRNRLED